MAAAKTISYDQSTGLLELLEPLGHHRAGGQERQREADAERLEGDRAEGEFGLHDAGP